MFTNVGPAYQSKTPSILFKKNWTCLPKQDSLGPVYLNRTHLPKQDFHEHASKVQKCDIRNKVIANTSTIATPSTTKEYSSN